MTTKMSTELIRPHLLAYDIRCERRLGRVYRLVTRKAMRVQYSLYLLWLSPGQAQHLLKQLKTLTKQEDDLRLYPLPLKPNWSLHGKKLMSDNISIFNHTYPQPSSQDSLDNSNQTLT